MKLATVYCIVSTTGCPEEGRPFKDEIQAVHRTRVAADQTALLLEGEELLIEKAAP